MSEEDYRKELMLRLYDQLWNSINVRITGMWQCISVLAGAFVILALVEKGTVSLDVAVSMIILIAGWLLWSLQDASYWYNRNLCIVANIEKQFFRKSDTKYIHYYMGEHRPQKMIAHLRIQYCLGMAIIGIFIFYHFSERILPGFSIPLNEATLDLKRALPYITISFVVVLLVILKKEHNRKYRDFLNKSPGTWANNEKQAKD